MFTKPIVVYTTPFFANQAEIMILNPDRIVGIGQDSHKNMFITSVDGIRYYIAENDKQTVIELCSYMYKDSGKFGASEIENAFTEKTDEQE